MQRRGLNFLLVSNKYLAGPLGKLKMMFCFLWLQINKILYNTEIILSFPAAKRIYAIIRKSIRVLLAIWLSYTFTFGVIQGFFKYWLAPSASNKYLTGYRPDIDLFQLDASRNLLLLQLNEISYNKKKNTFYFSRS